MDAHVIPIGWAYNVNGQPIPNPAAASASSGWREHGCTDLNGVPLNLAARLGGDVLTDSEVASGFASRAQIVAAFGCGAGWNPQP